MLLNKVLNSNNIKNFQLQFSRISLSQSAVLIFLIYHDLDNIRVSIVSCLCPIIFTAIESDYKRQMNPLIKNCRTGCHDDILNRTSHYYKILNTKSTIDNCHDKNYLSLLNQTYRNKFTEDHKLSVNLKMIKSIFDIDRKQSRYIPVGDNQHSRKKSLKNQYLEKRRILSLSENNVRLLKNILKAKSNISCEKMNDFNQKMTSYSKHKSNLVRHVTEMDQQFFDTYRQNLFQSKSSPPKHYQTNIEDCNIKSKKSSQNRKKRPKQIKLDKIQKERANTLSIKQNDYIKVQS